MKKVFILLWLAACVGIFCASCGHQAENAVFIYPLQNGQQGSAMITLTWDDQDALKTITKLLNETIESKEISKNTEMQYRIELVNSNVKNDIFDIGFVDGKVCCNGEVQGVRFDHAVSSTVQQADIEKILHPA